MFESWVIGILEWGGKFESRTLEIVDGNLKDSANRRAVKEDDGACALVTIKKDES